MTITSAPAAGRDRDGERRRRIIDTAGRLFASGGYAGTGIGEIAAAARLGPATIYRLVGSKQELLTEAILGSLAEAFDAVVAIDIANGDAPNDLATLALAHRHLGALWQRDTRHLTPTAQEKARSLIRRFAARLREQIQSVRSDLDDRAAEVLGWAMVATMISPSLHHVPATMEEYHRRIVVILGRILAAPIPTTILDPPHKRDPAMDRIPVLPSSRREALIVAAVRQFARRGYADVTLDDIGAAVGATGPSVYHHFPSKQQLLDTAAARAITALNTSVTGAYLAATNEADTLDALLTSYIQFATGQHELLSMLITESVHLSADDRAHAAASERAYFGEWVNLLRVLRSTHQAPDIDQIGADTNTDCLIDVHAVADIINNVVRIPHLRQNPGVVELLPAVARWVLKIA